MFGENVSVFFDLYIMSFFFIFSKAGGLAEREINHSNIKSVTAVMHSKSQCSTVKCDTTLLKSYSSVITLPRGTLDTPQDYKNFRTLTGFPLSQLGVSSLMSVRAGGDSVSIRYIHILERNVCAYVGLTRHACNAWQHIYFSHVYE